MPLPAFRSKYFGLIVASLCVTSAAYPETASINTSDLSLMGVPGNHVLVADHECTARVLPVDVRNVGTVPLRITAMTHTRISGQVAIHDSPVHANYLTNNLTSGSMHRFNLHWEPTRKTVSKELLILTYGFAPDAIASVRLQIDETSGQQLSKATKRLEQARILGPDVAAHDARIAEKINAWLEKESELDDRIAAAQLALDELRAGLFCSRCGNPKSVIEKTTGKSFSEHLGQVRGTAKPAPAKDIAKAEQVVEKAEAAKEAAQARHYLVLDSLRKLRAKAEDDHKGHLEDLRQGLLRAEARYQLDKERLGMLTGFQKDLTIELTASCDGAPAAQ